MKEIIVLWSHGDDPTIPPLVCPDTCRTVKDVIKEFQDQYSGKSLLFIYSEEISPGKDKMEGTLTIDGTPLEDLVPLPDPSKYCGMACTGCGTGESSSCTRIYEQIPESVLRLALSKAAGRYT